MIRQAEMFDEVLGVGQEVAGVVDEAEEGLAVFDVLKGKAFVEVVVWKWESFENLR